MSFCNFCFDPCFDPCANRCVDPCIPNSITPNKPVPTVTSAPMPNLLARIDLIQGPTTVSPDIPTDMDSANTRGGFQTMTGGGSTMLTVANNAAIDALKRVTSYVLFNPNTMMTTAPVPPEFQLPSMVDPQVFRSPADVRPNEGGMGFLITGGNPSLLLMVTTDGTAHGWNLDNPDAEERFVGGGLSSYTGAVLDIMPTRRLLITDFGNSAILALNDAWLQIPLPPGAFTDLTLPPGYAPYNIERTASRYFVSYALKDLASPPQALNMPGNGIINSYDFNGLGATRLVTNGDINGPYGMVAAIPATGLPTGSFLVTNHNDGTINTHSPTGAFLGKLIECNGIPIVIEGIWDLIIESDTTYIFTSGPSAGTRSLIGRLTICTP